MNREELDSYQCQLDQVQLALQSDPENSELLKLQHDLSDLIALTKTFLQQQNVPTTKSKSPKHHEAPPSPHSPVFTTAPTEHTWKVGDNCLVKWPIDGKYYEGVIVAISSDEDFTVTYKGYGSTETVTKDDLKLPKNQAKKRKTDSVFDTKVTPNKKKNLLPKKETLQRKQEGWLKFANKKTIKTPAINKKSIFASPASIEGKVGVTSSGKPMTQFTTQHRHVFKV
ncbi:hypothetical protein K7432_013659 [Basidiobolus ranarum]|uniref:Tudor domain-containing protein n=1 Tax=Basidiobolus ranarum TaxID=34480 RepID=A0ABR2WIU9_9FUNG